MRRHIIDDKRKVEKSINHRKCFIRNACAQSPYKLRRLVLYTYIHASMSVLNPCIFYVRIYKDWWGLFIILIE